MDVEQGAFSLRKNERLCVRTFSCVLLKNLGNKNMARKYVSCSVLVVRITSYSFN